MKRTPIKGRLGNFFSSLGKEARAGQKDRGIFSEKGKAEKKSRKAGESKFQADVRRRREEKKPRKQSEISVEEQIKAADKQFGEGVQVTAKKTKPKATKLTFKQAFAAAREAGNKTFEWRGNPYTTELK